MIMVKNWLKIIIIISELLKVQDCWLIWSVTASTSILLQGNSFQLSIQLTRKSKQESNKQQQQEKTQNAWGH